MEYQELEFLRWASEDRRKRKRRRAFRHFILWTIGLLFAFVALMVFLPAAPGGG
jgi:fatty acid desaturase